MKRLIRLTPMIIGLLSIQHNTYSAQRRPDPKMAKSKQLRMEALRILNRAFTINETTDQGSLDAEIKKRRSRMQDIVNELKRLYPQRSGKYPPGTTGAGTVQQQLNTLFRQRAEQAQLQLKTKIKYAPSALDSNSQRALEEIKETASHNNTPIVPAVRHRIEEPPPPLVKPILPNTPELSLPALASDEDIKEKVGKSTLLAVADTTKIFSLTNTQGTLTKHNHKVDEPNVRSLHFHSAGSFLSALKYTTLTNLTHNDHGFTIDGNYPLPEEIDSIAHHPSQMFLASSSHVEGNLPYYCIRIYDLVDDARPLIFEAINREKGIVTLAYDPTGFYLSATNNVKNTVTMLLSDRTAKLSRPYSFPTHGKGSSRTAFSSKGLVSTINTLSDDISVSVCCLFGSLTHHGRYGSGGTHPVALDYDPTGDYLAVAHDQSQDITLLSHDRRKHLQCISRYSLDAPPTSLAFKPLPITQEKDLQKGANDDHL